ncbi:MAG: hypothetical protein ACR2G2_09010 [Pseudonocardia sp.]
MPNLQVGGQVADRKIEVMRPYRAAQAATGRSGVAAWAAWGGPVTSQTPGLTCGVSVLVCAV